MDNFEKENKLLTDAWTAGAKAIRGSLGEYYTQENVEMITMMSVNNLITCFNQANADDVQKNRDDFILVVRGVIDLRIQALNAKQGKFQS
jgi:hypothetical protein